MATPFELPVRENCFMFSAPDGDVSVDDLIDAIEETAGDDSVLLLQNMGGAKFLVCTRNAGQATKLMVAEGFRVSGVNVPVEAVGPPVTYVNVYRYPGFLSDETLSNALAQFDTADTETGPTRSASPTTPASPSGAEDWPPLATLDDASAAPPEQEETDHSASNAPTNLLAPVTAHDLGGLPQAPAREDRPIVSRGHYALPEVDDHASSDPSPERAVPHKGRRPDPPVVHPAPGRERQSAKRRERSLPGSRPPWKLPLPLVARSYAVPGSTWFLGPTVPSKESPAIYRRGGPTNRSRRPPGVVRVYKPFLACHSRPGRQCLLTTLTGPGPRDHLAAVVRVYWPGHQATGTWTSTDEAFQSSQREKTPSGSAYGDFLQFFWYRELTSPRPSFFRYSSSSPAGTTDPSNRFPVSKTSRRPVYHIDAILEYRVGLQQYGYRFSVGLTVYSVLHTGQLSNHFLFRLCNAWTATFGSRTANARAPRPIHIWRDNCYACYVSLFDCLSRFIDFSFGFPSSPLPEQIDNPGEAVNDDDAPDVPVDDPAMDMPPDNTALLSTASTITACHTA
ncbi:hypothetical protein MRX96_018173 [Rhipicephalus microplus]